MQPSRSRRRGWASGSIIGLALAACAPVAPPATVIPWPDGLPVYDHIVIVVEENKDWADIIGNDDTPYINDILKEEGALFTNSFGLEHHSQGNYFWLFSGDNQGVGFDDKVPGPGTPGYPFETANLGAALIGKGLSFKGYAESLPTIGATLANTVDNTGTSIYARKHVPWISFANVPNGTTVETSSNLRFADFPSDYSELPTVAFVIPNLENDMHTMYGLPKAGVQQKNAAKGGISDDFIITDVFAGAPLSVQ